LNARRRWTVEDALELYGVKAWSHGYFSANEKGNVTLAPANHPGPGVDLKELVDELVERGIDLPLLIRFSDVLKARVTEINEAFARAIKEYEYQGFYRGVYPIKVNQNRFLVKDLVTYGRPYHFGLEAGSKPELLAVMAMLSDEEALVVCNGYKDEEYVETALLASRLGPKVIVVAEKPAELRLIAEIAARTGIAPMIGIRARLSTRGAGHWEASGGDHSKFGFGAREMVEAVDVLKEKGLLTSLVLLHFHLGSQISSIRNIKDALREAGWIYANLVRLGVPLAYLDVGGGLGIDYDGTQSNFSSSMNYTLQEYANDVVYGVMEVCDRAEVPHPVLVTESGRATVAHHAVLVFEVLEAGESRVGKLPEALPENAAPVLEELFGAYRELTPKNLRETYHDAQQYRDECLSLFNLGHLSLTERVLAEDVFWALCRKIHQMAGEQSRRPEELQGLDRALARTYYCNFSVFQSLPDSWAIDHLFPILPLHRLGEHPSEKGVLADMTCDSDGKIERFIDQRGIRRTLELHPLSDEPYYLGAFLIGAYQEILGDLHNLFGDTNAVHVALDEKEGYRIEHVVAGDTVTEVLEYVEYQRGELVARLRAGVEKAIRAGRMTREQAKELLKVYETGLSGSTYLERP
jgi:arginine decarboxylase